MKKTGKLLKNNIKFFISFVLGGIVLGGVGVYAAVASSSISYSNSNSGLSATNVQGAIDELSTKTDIRKSSKIVEAYTYNASTCVTGEESTCVPTTCHKKTTANSCKAGDIIRYKVNDTDIVTFHVMYDSGTTMTMQSQKNTINNTMWISSGDYATENTDSTSCSYTSCTDEGPMTALVALERATQGWTNVNNQTYTMGTTSLSSKGAYTGCSAYNSCTTNKYTLPSRTSKARMITVQEAADLGCNNTARLCPKWMYNYLYTSTSYGGTANDNTAETATGSYNSGYWTMNPNSSNTNNVWLIRYYGDIFNYYAYGTTFGARAVVVINK